MFCTMLAELRSDPSCFNLQLFDQILTEYLSGSYVEKGWISEGDCGLDEEY